VKQIGIFAVLLLMVTVGGGFAFTALYPGPEGARAVWTSAVIATVVQGVGFGLAFYLRKENVMAGWGAGMLLRLLTVGLYGMVFIKVLGLQSAPALISMVSFFFVTTLFEPLLLKP
jgi:hypothetical protein